MISEVSNFGLVAASSTATVIASMLARTSRAVELVFSPDSTLASARASSRTPSCIPSTFDDAIDSVRRSNRAKGPRLGPPTSLSSRIACSASETTPEVARSRFTLSSESGVGRNARYLQARLYFAGALISGLYFHVLSRYRPGISLCVECLRLPGQVGRGHLSWTNHLALVQFSS
jgi:hypothetical protein